MSIREITFDQLHPVVRFAAAVTPGSRALVLAADCRLFRLLSGEGTLQLTNRVLPLRENRLIYLPVGVPYRFAVSASARVFSVNFDLTHERAERQNSMPPFLYTPEGQARLSVYRVADCPLFDAPAVLPVTSEMQSALCELEQEYLFQRRYAAQKMSGCMLSLLAALARGQGTGAPGEYVQPADSVIAFIQTHYAEPLTNQSIGAALGYHPNYINRLTVLHTGQSLHRYLMTVRVHRALDLIQSTRQPLSLIAQSCGFQSGAHFSRCFKAVMGASPSAFRTDSSGEA